MLINQGILKALIVVTSHSQMGNTGKETGYYLPEVTHPFHELSAAGIVVDIASPKGGRAPLDKSSLDLSDPINRDFWQNPNLRGKLEKTRKLSDIEASEYDAIVFAGGHGTMWDFPNDPDIQRLASGIYAGGGVVAAVCHGPAALVNVKLANGAYLIANKNVAAFSNAEEEAAGLTKVMPFLLESAMIQRDAKYSKAPLWERHVVVDERLVTGQNPASAAGVGQRVAEILKN